MQIDLKTAQLLNSRLFHDLVGAVSAVNTGIEFMAEPGSDDGEVPAGSGLEASQRNPTRPGLDPPITARSRPLLSTMATLFFITNLDL